MLHLRPELGPLQHLAGTWEGIKGHDIAPSDDRGTETNLFREVLTLTPIGAVNNHEQAMQGLRYSTVAYRLGEDQAFHEEVGYWLWDQERKLVMRCFVVPRGVTVMAGGTVEEDARSFHLSAELGSKTFGILSNPFLDQEFQTVRYTLDIKIHSATSWEYNEDTVLRIKGQPDLFHHKDQNILTRISV